jgi:hypothetical protein
MQNYNYIYPKPFPFVHFNPEIYSSMSLIPYTKLRFMFSKEGSCQTVACRANPARYTHILETNDE